MFTIGVAYFFAAVAASGIFIAAGWRSKNARAQASKLASQGLPEDVLWAEPEAGGSDPDDAADVSLAVRQTVKRLAPLIASHAVLADIAVRAGLKAHMKAAVLTDLLEELLTASIHSAPASRLLIAAKRDADYVYVAITDDMPNADHAVRQGRIRGLMERVAARGAALDISVWPKEGTTMTLRLAAAHARGEPDAQPAENHPLPTATPV